MISKYGIFCEVIKIGNFTRVAEIFGYSQSAISQSIKGLESELGFTLIDRRKDGIRLTNDGEQFYPYILSVYNAEKELMQKTKEMSGMVNNTIMIGTFTGVSRSFLPRIMQLFKQKYPDVNFVLKQGEYSNIEEWIKDGSIDFGFVNQDAVAGIETHFLYDEEMKAVLPMDHGWKQKDEISLKELMATPFILLDEGSYSVPMKTCQEYGVEFNPAYKVYDDYTILSMVKQNIGVSLLYESVLDGFSDGISTLPVREKPKRKVALAWRNYSTLSFAAKEFIDFIKKNI